MVLEAAGSQPSEVTAKRVKISSLDVQYAWDKE